MAKDWTHEVTIKELEYVIKKQDDEIERLREAICDMKQNIRTVDRAFMKESTQDILDAIEKSDEDNPHK